jgi:hypothetical protein
VLLLHDSACPHTATHTVETLRQLNFEVLEHPLHSPGLAPSDYHLFGPLSHALKGRHFASDQVVKEVWFMPGLSLNQFFFEGMEKL